MDDRQLIELFRDAGTPEEVKKATDSVASEILAAPAAIVRAWTSGAPSEADKAGMVMLDLGFLPLQPMLAESQAETTTADFRVRILMESAETWLGARAQVFRRLDELLNAGTAIPPEEAEAGWPDSTPLRICDKAYLWIHRLVRVGHTDPKGFLTETSFLSLAQAQRDREIHRWRRSEFWRMLRRTE